ncbi:MAG: diguanylate cyclase [Magnetococcales bacterium]|nr:diguanylate cyclase [Magnetococcales bacterium]NGZ27642.1 diguanylate cyclase [Magnetococcales bacterium]
MNVNRFRIGVRVTIGVVIPLLLLVFVGSWSWIASDKVFKEVEQVRDDRLHLTLLAQQLGKDLVHMQYYLTEVAINKAERNDGNIFSGAEDYYHTFLKNLNEYEEHSKKLNNGKVDEKIATLRKKVVEFFATGKRMAEAFVNDRTEEGFLLKESFDEEAEYFDFLLEPLLRRERDSSVAAMDALVGEMARLKQGVLLVMMVAMVVSSLVGWLLVRSLVHPIVTMKGAMHTVSTGNFGHQVPVIGQDELSDMAKIFNLMAQELAKTYSGLVSEKEKLATIILSAREGIVVTDRQKNIVLVNPSAERLLGKTHEEILAGGFFQLVDDPDYITAHLSGSNPPETIVYKSQVLSVYASPFFDENKVLVGAAALIRDITNEKRLEDQLREQSQTDALTGLFNRRKFDATMEMEVERARRYKHHLSLVLFDVDHFKKFNDTYGHDQGDRVLQAVGRQMKKTLRNLDVCCRYGGEEFVAILPGTPSAGAERSAERLRADIEAMVVDGLKVTISLGVVAYPDCGIANVEAMVKMADNALYQAKKGGRNQYKLAEMPPPPPPAPAG